MKQELRYVHLMAYNVFGLVVVGELKRNWTAFEIEDSSIVKEYKDENELIHDLASYRFTTLPVINNGVEIKDIALFEVNLLP